MRLMRADCLRCGQQYAAANCVECVQCHPLGWIDVARSYGSYGGELGAVLRQYKYRCDRSLVPGLVRLLEIAFGQHFKVSEWDGLVAVPIHRSRLRERGFDHLGLLARYLSKRLRLSEQKALVKRIASPSQAGLSEKQRRRNVRGTFLARQRMDRCRLLLLDDILTTGATANECARVLKRAGTSRVGVLTVARAE